MATLRPRRCFFLRQGVPSGKEHGGGCRLLQGGRLPAGFRVQGSVLWGCSGGYSGHGIVLRLFWGYVGEMMVLCWGIMGVILGILWGYVGDVGVLWEIFWGYYLGSPVNMLS